MGSLPDRRPSRISCSARTSKAIDAVRARKEPSCGGGEGLNTNVERAPGKARGFKSYEVAATALFHELGRLPEPAFTHRFC